MKHEKQVDKSHYKFSSYMSKNRWNSVWHQVDEVLRLHPKNVLEIGPGSGVFKLISSVFDLKVETLDLDPELAPDHVGSATELPFTDTSYDVVCGFQVLEHLPYELALQAFKEMARVSKRNVVISLPDAKVVWRYHFQLPKIGSYELFIPRPRIRKLIHMFDGEHYWEINKKGYEFERIVNDFSKYGTLTKTYRVAEFTYHRFFVFDTSY